MTTQTLRHFNEAAQPTHSEQEIKNAYDPTLNNSSMSEDNYDEFVTSRCKPGEDILASLTPLKCHLLHMTLLLSGESGEFCDALKKHIMYEASLDMENVLEELGDIEFALSAIRSALGVKRQEILDGNYGKLSKRYSEGSFSNEAAQNRADKQEGE